MVVHRTCSFCAGEIEPGTGQLFVKRDGSLYSFCSSSCRKQQMGLGRVGHRLRWTHAHELKRLAEQRHQPAATEAPAKTEARKSKAPKESAPPKAESALASPKKAAKPKPAAEEGSASSNRGDEAPKKSKAKKPAPPAAPG